MIVLSLPLHVLKLFNATIINNRYPSAISTFVEKWCILTTSNNSTHLNDENPSNWSSGDAVDGVAGRELRHSCCEARHARFEGGHPVELSDLSAIDHKALTFNNLISYCHDQTLVAKDFQAPSTWRLFLRDPQRGSLGSAGRCTSSSDMLDLEKHDRNGRDGDWRETFVDLQNSSDIFSVCSILPVCE